MRRRLAGFLLTLFMCISNATAPRAEDTFPSPQETLREFETVCRKLREGDNPYFGEGDLRRARERAVGYVGDSQESAARLGHYGWQLLRLGQPKEAIEQFEKARTRAVAVTEPQGEELRQTLTSLLALAHFQAAEDVNCLGMHNSSSCIIPVADDAKHELPEHARAAGDLFLEILEQYPNHDESRWLLNLSRMVSGDYPSGVPQAARLPAEITPPIDARRWQNVGPLLGVDAVDLSGGAIVEDFDGDGSLDIVASSVDWCEPVKAYRNRGNQGFEDVTRAWGLDGQLGGLNLIQADYDNDGRVDILVLRGGWYGRDGRVRNSLLRNRLDPEGGGFIDVTAAAGLAYPAYPTQTAAWADYDSDGDLDLYVGNESEGTAVYTSKEFMEQIGDIYPGQMFRNNGDGTFTDIARRAGVTNLRYAKAVAWGDVDEDGDPDLYISNIGPNRLYRNNGDGTFDDVAEAYRVTEPSGRSFPIWFFDFNNDGRLDLLVTDYGADMKDVFRSYLGYPTTGGHPLLYRNEGGRFREMSVEAGIRRPILPMGANYGDLDGDGFPDLFLSTGVPDFESLMPNAVYRNIEGRRFEEVTFTHGFGHIQKGHGVAFGDLDNDGDQDVFHQLGGAYPFDIFANALYLNPSNGHHWITLRLQGRQANRFAIGGRIEVRIVEKGKGRSVHSLVGSGGSFGASSLQQEIGLGAASKIEWIKIRWPGSGTVQTFRAVQLDRFYSVIEGEPELLELAVPRFDLLAGAQPGRHHQHHEDSP
jgi:hypothetical protein